jgi:hypothetical protein
MFAFAQYPIPLAQAYELDLGSGICEGLVSYIACLPQHGMVPREFHPNGETRPFVRAGTTGTELKARLSTATRRGLHSAYPMATTSSGATDAWTLSYGSSNIIDGSKSICLVTLGYASAVSVTRKRLVRYYSSSGSVVLVDHGNGSVSSLIGSCQVTGALFADVQTTAPTAGVDLLFGYEYTPGSGTQSMYMDGVLTTPGITTAQTANVLSVTDVCLANNVSGAPLSGGIAISALWNRTLTASEHAALAANPYLPLRRTGRRLYSIPASGIMGTLAATETDADTAALAGQVLVQGALAATETGADTLAATGTVSGGNIAGTLAAAETGSDTFAASSSVPPVIVGFTIVADGGTRITSLDGVVIH